MIKVKSTQQFIDKDERVKRLQDGRKNTQQVERPDVYTYDNLIEVVQLRLSNEFADIVSKKDTRFIIQTVLLSIVDLSLRKSVVLSGLLKATKYVLKSSGRVNVKFKLSNVLKLAITDNQSLFPGDKDLVILDDIVVDKKADLYLKKLKDLRNNKKIHKSLNSFTQQNIDNSQKDLTHHVICDTINYVGSEGQTKDNLKSSERGVSNQKLDNSSLDNNQGSEEDLIDPQEFLNEGAEDDSTFNVDDMM